MFSEGRNWCFSDTYGPAVALERNGQSQLWRAKHKTSIFDGEEIELEFWVTMGKYSSGEWKVIVVVERRDQPMIQFAVDLPGEKQFTVSGQGGRTLVRPLEIFNPDLADG
jgi:hypothetical protein